MDAITAQLKAMTERLNTAAKLQPSMREGMDAEPNLLEPWPKRRTTCARTTYLRRNYDASDVAYLRLLAVAPDPMSALAEYRSTHTRALVGKRRPIEADPDPVCHAWRDRPERKLSAEDLIRSQFSGRALRRELRRLR
jgi:hypothetical protein